MNIISTNRRLNKKECAELLNLKVYDTAVPQEWLDKIFLKLSFTPESKLFPENWREIILSSLVWCYEDDKIKLLMGCPICLTKRAFDLLSVDEEVKNEFLYQKTIIETRTKFEVEGKLTVLDVILAEDTEEAKKIFWEKYRGVKIIKIEVKG
jgi:hypothetical protein